MKPLGLYIHFPYCAHKCGYCDFNSWKDLSMESQQLWLKGIYKQLEFWAPRTENYKVDTVFFGGGTPSLLDNQLLIELGLKIQDSFNLTNTAEWTVECNPETINEAKLHALAECGADRLSMGVQSFQDNFLVTLERQASVKTNVKALDLIADIWDGRWSFDLMFALPGQSLNQWRKDCEQAMSYGVKHISAYELTLTTARALSWKKPSESEILPFYEFNNEFFKDFGLEKYEVSNFAAPGEESRHNLKYWELDPFLSLGPGGAGLLPNDLVGGDHDLALGYTQKNPNHFESWMSQAGNYYDEMANCEARSLKSHIQETLMMGLRLKKGISLGFLGELGIAESDLMQPLTDKKLIDNVDGCWRVAGDSELLLDFLITQLFHRLDHLLEAQDIDYSQAAPKLG